MRFRNKGALALLGLALVAAGAEEDSRASMARYADEDRKAASKILESATFELESRFAFRSSPGVFLFLVHHPEFAATVSRGIGHTEYFVHRDDGKYRVVHGHARGVFWEVERRPDQVAYLARGSYESPLFKWLGFVVDAQSYVVERFEGLGAPPAEGGAQVVHVRAYLHVDETGAGWLVRLFAPLVRTVFEDKLIGAYRIAPELSQMAFLDREGFLAKLRGVEGLEAAQLKTFVALTRRNDPAAGGRTPRRAARVECRAAASTDPAHTLSSIYELNKPLSGVLRTREREELKKLIEAVDNQAGAMRRISRSH